MQQDAALPGSAAAGGAGSPLEPAQRAVIRSLATQVATLQLRLEQAGLEHSAAHDGERLSNAALAPGSANGERGGSPAGLQAPSRGSATDKEALLGMVSLLKQQLASLDRIQQQLALQNASSPGPASGASSNGSTSDACHLPSVAQAAALLGTELPPLLATMSVVEAEVWSMVVQREAPLAAAPPSPAGETGRQSGCMACLLLTAT